MLIWDSDGLPIKFPNLVPSRVWRRWLQKNNSNYCSTLLHDNS